MTIIAATVLAAGACTSTQTGQPSPTGQPTSGDPTSSPAASGLRDVKACALLNQSEAQRAVPGIGAPEDQGEFAGSASSCRWTKSATAGQGGFVVGIAVRPTQSIKDVAVTRPDETLSNATTSGGRQAVVQRNGQGQGSCAISIAVGSGRVDIDGQTLRGTTQDACSVVSKVSDYAEPKLPAS
ncbi:DUF3558 family protein [Amycolatopsis sp.]|uniref:DUF3558 family protein n=1 Tax=Amycolatopsis sp. TaxID=37632 RepID=UPI0039C85E2D